MPLPPLVLVLVLSSAAMHAAWNALVKAGGDRLVLTTLVMMGPVPVCIVALFFLPDLPSAAWPFLLASTVIHYAYYVLLIAAYGHGDLSQVYPISRGAAPALVALAAWIYARENLSAVETAGVLIVSLGVMSLAWRRGVRPRAESTALALALLNAIVIASYLVVDGTGVRRAADPLTYIAWLFVLEGVPLLGFTLWRRRHCISAAFSPYLAQGTIGGVIAGISYAIAVWAMSLGPMAHVVALRETSVLMGAAIGVVMLKESFGLHRIVSAAVVAVGAVLLNSGL